MRRPCGKLTYSGRRPAYDTHPTEKPVAPLTRIIKIASEPGDLVVDPFTGSGTTAVVASVLGRRFTGFEIDAGYAEMARKRIADLGLGPNFNRPSPQKIHGSTSAQTCLPG